MKAWTTVVRLVIAGALMAFTLGASGQQVYPGRAIRIILPYPAGGGLDVLARLVGKQLSEAWGQPVIVDNRPGGNTVIGTDAVFKAAPDGYTILLTASSHVLIPQLLRTPYDPIKDFAPIATVTSSEYILVVNGVNTLQELIALAKSKPGQLNYASSGSGGTTHLAAELFSMMAGIKMQHIPYPGGVPALTDVAAGRVQMYFSPSIIAIPLIKSERIKGIAISGTTRLSLVPQVPTFTEAGLPGFDVKTWYGFLAPAGTPKAIVDKLATELARVIALPEIKATLASQAVDPFVTTPEQFAALMKADMDKNARIIKEANIKMEN